MAAGLAEALKRDSALSLDQAAVGCDFQVISLEGPECRRLREIGFCEEMRVRPIASGRLLVCAVCGTRLALSRELARQVRVVPC
jgi:Fe2+ transport system protein FeoA